MKKINLIGPVDKRLLAYPLLKAIDLVGKCLIITDDANFRRFADDYSLKFNVGNSDYVIVNDMDNFNADNLEQPMSAYDYVLFITTNTLIDSDITVYCHGLEKSFVTDDIKSQLQEMEHTDIYITPSKLKLKNIIQIPVGKNMEYVWACEENKQYLPSKNESVNKIISSVFAETLGYSKDEVVKLLGRKDG